MSNGYKVFVDLSDVFDLIRDVLNLFVGLFAVTGGVALIFVFPIATFYIMFKRGRAEMEKEDSLTRIHVYSKCTIASLFVMMVCQFIIEFLFVQVFPIADSYGEAVALILNLRF